MMRRWILFEGIPGPLASIYEKATRTVIESYYAEIADSVVSALKSGRLLDLGTGPGYLPIEILKRSPSIRIVGLDLSPRLVGTARTNAMKAGLAPRVSFQVGNAAEIPFENNTFDMVISTGMLHMLRDPVKVLGECYRVLRPGGRAWVYDPARVGPLTDKKKWELSLTPRERILSKLLPLFRRLNPPQTYDKKQVLAMITSTPFRDYLVKDLDGEIRIALKK